MQRWLAESDRRWLGRLLDDWARRWSGNWLGYFLELAYLLCYPVIPAGVGVLYWTHKRSAIDEYWAVVLSARCLCYLCVALAQTLPPRLLETGMSVELAPGRGKLRRFNLFLIRRASIQLNTFPSAHVASAMAAALVVMRYVPGAGAVMLLIAFGIAAGAVLGRYHYALDVLFGGALAACAAIGYRLP